MTIRERVLSLEKNIYPSVADMIEKSLVYKSKWATIQSEREFVIQSSRHLLKLYEKKKNSIRDYLHEPTCHIVEYCKKEEIYTVVIGDITSIRKKKIADIRQTRNCMGFHMHRFIICLIINYLCMG